MITGEYKNALDDKGRLMVPSKIRSEITGNVLVVTRGLDKCLWLFPPEGWNQIAENLMGAASPFTRKARLLQRWIIAPAQEIELDKAGRINLPGTLKEYAHLSKECIILGINKYLEVWDEGEYHAYLDGSEAEFQKAAEELGGLVSF